MASPITSSDDTGQAVDLPALSQVTPSLPQASQSSSLLMQLPAELRLMVLRRLLVGNTPISSRESYGHPYMVHNRERERDARGRFIKQTRKRTVSGYYFTPSVISTCQQLFGEALPILYHENTVQINIAMYWDPTLYLHPRNLMYVCVRLTMFDSEDVLTSVCQRKTENETRLKIARRFRNFLISVNNNPDPLHLVQLRHLFKVLAPWLFASNIEVMIDSSCLTSSSAPRSNILTGHHLQLMKAFTLLRCSRFHFTGLSAPAALDVQRIITSSTPIVNLSDFESGAIRMLNVLFRHLVHGAGRNQEMHSLKNRIVDAVADFDVGSFLQARFDILQMWRNLERKMWKGTFQHHDHEFYDLLRVNWYQYNVSDSAELGLELREEGKVLNAELRNLAAKHNFAPVVDADPDAEEDAEEDADD